MDQNGDPTVQATNESQGHYQFIKKTLQFLVPLSLLSFSFCHITGFSFYFTYINFQFSTFIFALFAHALDRKFMFLICNSILAFLAKNSSLFKQIPQLHEMIEATVEDNEASMKSSVLENVAVAEEEKQQENYVNVNTDELNKKIEEFIKKMKEEIRIEAQQQFVGCN